MLSHAHPEISVAQHLGARRTQQDRFLLTQIGEGYLLAVLDGHGGPETADCACARLPTLLQEHASALWRHPAQTERMFQHIFVQLQEACRSGSRDSGTTLTLAWFAPSISPQDGAPAWRLNIATLGDSPLALTSADGYFAAPEHAVDLHPRDVQEIREILAHAKQRPASREMAFRLAAAEIRDGRIWIGPSPHVRSGIELTRALGDFAFDPLLLRTPYTETLYLPGAVTLFLATDGIRTPAPDTERHHHYRNILHAIAKGQSASGILNGLTTTPNQDNTTLLTARLPALS